MLLPWGDFERVLLSGALSFKGNLPEDVMAMPPVSHFICPMATTVSVVMRKGTLC